MNNNTNINEKSIDIDNLYLEKLEFKKSDEKIWINFFIKKFRVVILLIILIITIGIYSFIKIPRELNPEVNIPIAIISTVYPGVSPSDIEELITKKIESAIAGIPGVSKITSYSSNSVSTISVEFEASQNIDKSIQKVKDEVDKIKNKLPKDASDPKVTEVSLDESPVWIFSISGPYDGFTMKKYADEIQTALENIGGIKEVRVSGGDQKEIAIFYKLDKLQYYNLSIDTINQIIAATNTIIPAGLFDNKQINYPIRIDSRFFNVKDLLNLPIAYVNGSIIYLSDVAIVKEIASKVSKYSRVSLEGKQSQNSINFSIIKKPGSSIIDTIQKGKKVLEEQLKKMPPDIKISDNINYADYIKEDFDQLNHDMILTIILVFSILFLLIGIKEAFIAGIVIPLSFAIALFVMYINGITLNFLSIFALLLSLGLLVDDAIVVVSATKQYMKTGKFTPEQAVLLVLKDFQFPLITTTLTTIWAFLPLVFASGIMGQFLKSITITVSVALASSTLVALIINHPLSAVLERIRFNRIMFYLTQLFLYIILYLLYIKFDNIKKYIVIIGIILFLVINLFYIFKLRKILLKNEELQEKEYLDDNLIKLKLKNKESKNTSLISSLINGGFININKISNLYSKILYFLIKSKLKRLIFLMIIFTIFLSAIYLPISGTLKSEFFPTPDGKWIYINIEMPSGYTLQETDKITKEIESKLLKYKEIKSFATVVGQPVSSSRLIQAESSNENKASITITLVDSKQRNLKSYELEKIIRKDLSDIKNAEINITVPAGGPPSGAAFEAQIKGDDINVLYKIAKDLKEKYLEKINGVVDTKISLKQSAAEYSITFDQEKMRIYNVNPLTIYNTIKMAVNGNNITDIIKEGKEIKVMAYINNINSLYDLENIQVINNQNQYIYLKDIAKINLNPSVDTIQRIDQKRVVVLTASTTGKTSSVEVLKEFQKNIKDYKFPDGYEISYGGQNKTNMESVQSIFYGMIVTVILIITTMVIQFNSFKQAFIVLMTIPLALIGVFYGFTFFNLKLSFPSLIGILALFGIVVKNAIILIDKININLKYNIPFLDAIVDAGKSRLEAIIITSITTILGIIPITLSDETWKGLGSAIIFGLSISSIFTLFVIPILFATIIKKPKKIGVPGLEPGTNRL